MRVKKMITEPKINGTMLVSAFPGTGKTYLVNHDAYLGCFSIMDSDSSKFDKSNFPQNYIAHIKENIGIKSHILISSHKEVRAALVLHSLPFVLVYPDISLKEEYIGRYKKRGNSDVFIKLINDHWEEWISELTIQVGCEHIVLKSGQFLTNFI